MVDKFGHKQREKSKKLLNSMNFSLDELELILKYEKVRLLRKIWNRTHSEEKSALKDRFDAYEGMCPEKERDEAHVRWVAWTDALYGIEGIIGQEIDDGE